MENWKQVDGTDLYMVSDQGNVKSLSWHYTGKEKQLTYFKDHKGYLWVILSIKGKRTKIRIHQLVWITFKNDYRTGTTKGLMINHINRVKEDNRLTNLELVTNTENVNHSIDKTKFTSMYPNVSWHKEAKKWIARGDVKGTQRKYVGLFETEEEAYEAFQRAKQEAENIYN